MSEDEALYATIGAQVVPQLLYAMARLGVADVLAAGPLDLPTLAARVGADPMSLERALRALASVGVFARGRDGRVRLTPAAQPLRADHPRSQRARVLFAGGEQHRAWGAVMHSLTTGGAAFDHAYGESFAEHLARDAAAMDAAEAFRERRSERRDLAIAERLRLGRTRTICDVGGGTGELLALLLERHPRLRGALFEAPHVAARARARLARRGLAARCEVLAGDARRELPPGHDAYLLVEVLHCYDDRAAIEILRRCAGRRVHVIERVLPARARASAAFLADMHMLVMYGGRERTREEYRELFAAAGLRLLRVTPTSSWLAILTAAPVGA